MEVVRHIQSGAYFDEEPSGLPDRLNDSMVAQLVKNSPAMQETWIQSLGWEDLLEKEMVTWEIPWTEEPGGLQFMGL